MSKDDFYDELENIQYKYQRLESMIGILQMFVADVVEIAGAPDDCLNDALFEIEMEMGKTNGRLKSLLTQESGVA